jgi:site-specific DNA-methyltransferase (adenine-specific)
MIEPDNIYCGDCLELMKQMPDKSVDLIVTSPPYPGNNSMWSDLYKTENFILAHEFLNAVWTESLRILKPGCKLIINIANTRRRPYLVNTHEIYKWAESKCEPLGEIIWNKGYGQMGTAWGSYCNPSDPSLADQHEYILVFRKYGEREHKESGYFTSAHDFKSWRNSIWNIAPAKSSGTGHPALFPVEIPQRLILLYSYPDEIVLDPFIGYSTTALACIKTNRRYIGMEIDPTYYEIAKKRIGYEKQQLRLDLV